MADEQKTAGKLTQGPIGKQLFEMGRHMFWGFFAMMAFAIVDTYFVAQLGTAQLAAISFTLPVILLIGSVARGLSAGATSVISRAIGQGDVNRVKILINNSLSLSLIVVSILVIIGILTISPLFGLLGANAKVLSLIHDYMFIYYLGVFFVIVPMVGNGALRALGNAKLPGLIMTIGAIINTILDPILIFGWLGCPRMEMQGAALATVIANAFIMVTTLWWLYFQEKVLAFNKTIIRGLIESWKKILQVAMPTTLNNLIQPVSLSVITAMVAHYGQHAVAAIGLGNRIDIFIMLVYMSLASVLAPFVGQNWGGGLKNRVKASLLISDRFVIIYGIGIAVLLMLLHAPLIKLFDQHPDVLKIATFYLLLIPWSYGAEGLRYNANAAFIAIGKPAYSVYIMAIKMLVLYVPLAFLGSQIWGVRGIMGAAFIANLITGLMARYFIRQKIEIIDQTAIGHEH